MKMAKNPFNMKKEINYMFKTGNYEKLYSVRIFIENDAAGTDTWFIYDDFYYVKNYLKILRNHYRSLKDCKVINKYTYEYKTSDGLTIRERIEVKKYRRAA